MRATTASVLNSPTKMATAQETIFTSPLPIEPATETGAATLEGVVIVVTSRPINPFGIISFAPSDSGKVRYEPQCAMFFGYN